MTQSMFDSVDISMFPSNPFAVAGYVGGWWPTYSALVNKFPKAHHLSIAVTAGEDADCLDVERGDAVPSQAPSWVMHQIARGVKRPAVYSDAFTIPTVLDLLSKSGLKRDQYRVWVAHYTFSRPSFPFEEGGDAVQYTDRALNRSLDESVLASNFFETHIPVHHINPPHYSWFDKGPFTSPWGDLNEQKVVQQYDGARKHPLVYTLYLKKLENQLRFLADRVASIAIHQPTTIVNKPSWGLYRRGWRYQQLVHRSQGHRFV